MKLNKTIAAAALAGLFAGSAATASAAMNPTSGKAGSGNTSANTMAADDKHSCKGKNECKGKGGCKAGDNGCKAKNTCKGKGGCATDGSKPKK